MVNSEGVVYTHISVITIKLSCNFDVSDFPRDEQECFLRIATSVDKTYNISEPF